MSVRALSPNPHLVVGGADGAHAARRRILAGHPVGGELMPGWMALLLAGGLLPLPYAYVLRRR